MKKGLLFLSTIALIGCKNRLESKKNDHAYSVKPFIVFESQSPNDEPVDTIFITSPTDNNFIIDEHGRFFYYGKKKDHGWDCIPDENPLPRFIHLDPSQIIELSDKQIEEFVDLNIKKIENEVQLISVASARDTFKSPTLTKLIERFRKNHLGHVLRSMTEEEKVVLKYRKSGEDYFYRSIDWDTTKIKLDFKPEPIP